MERNKIHQHIQAFTLVLILFTFPFRPLVINNLLVVLLGVNWLLQGTVAEKWRTLCQRRIALLYVGLYVIFIISFFLSDDKKEAGKILERNLFVLFVPVILATSKVSLPEVVKAMYGFVAGCLLAALLSLGNAVYRFSLNANTDYFFYHDLSQSLLHLHAVYFSLYIAVSILFLMMQLDKRWGTISRAGKTVHITAIAFLLIVLTLLSSKTIIVTLAFSINVIFIVWIIRRNRKAAGVWAIIIVNLLLVIGIVKIDYVKDRFLDSLNYNIEFIKNDTYSELTVFTGVTVRLTFWKFVVEVLNENNSWWTGMSIGDADNALHKKAVEKNLYGGNKERGWTDYTSYNAHNQFFQFLLQIGVPGLAYFLFLLSSIFWYAARSKNLVLILSMLIFTSFCMTESVLAVHKGVIFFAILPPLLIYHSGNKTQADVYG